LEHGHGARECRIARWGNFGEFAGDDAGKNARVEVGHHPLVGWSGQLFEGEVLLGGENAHYIHQQSDDARRRAIVVGGASPVQGFGPRT
jgi:hypothetical protein